MGRSRSAHVLTGLGPLPSVLTGLGPLPSVLTGVGPLPDHPGRGGPLPAPARRGCQYQPVACEWFHARCGDPYRALM
jgi:hypothetical protein